MIYMFLSNNPSSGDINSSNLSCFSGNWWDALITHLHYRYCLSENWLVALKNTAAVSVLFI